MARQLSKTGLPKAVIENVSPSLDCGRFPVKRVLGDICHVSADIFKDGHDHLAARVRFREPSQKKWRTAALVYDFANDRWHGQFELNQIGRWSFTIDAWTDTYGTWREALLKKLDAGQDVSVELLEGAQIVQNAARNAAPTTRKRLSEVAERLVDTNLAIEIRAETALASDLESLTVDIVDDADVTSHARVYEIVVDPKRAGFAAWYEMFPRSQGTESGRHATFRDAEVRLPRLAELGFDVVYLPPIHPIGHSFRKGPNNTLAAGPEDHGSPWAIGSAEGGHTAIEPKLGTIDDFDHFVQAAEQLGMEIALDYALQCSPDHPWVKEHPDWFVIRPDGSIKYAENPPKKYQDIIPFNFWCEDRENLWRACKEVVEYWISHGVRTFRVDNPHTKPFVFWEWLISSVKLKFPEVVFLSEAFTRPKPMWGLAKLGFSQSYTYFTWKNTAAELKELMAQLHSADSLEYYRGNLFTNTPDILHAYLQGGGRAAFRVRLLLAATLSPLYGIYSGFELCENLPREEGSEEYLNSEKYEIRARNWDAPGNINDDISLLNRIRRDNPTLQTQGNLQFFSTDNDSLLCYSRGAEQGGFVVVVNLDPHHAQSGMVQIPAHSFGGGAGNAYDVEDLLTGECYQWTGERNYVFLDPAVRVGHVLRLLR